MYSLNRIPSWLRVALPLLVIMVWLIVGSLGGPTFGKINNVITNDQVSFLPSSADSTKVQTLQGYFYKTNTIPALVIVNSDHELSRSDLSILARNDQVIRNIKGVSTSPQAVIGPIPSKDGKAVEYIAQISDQKNINAVVKQMRFQLANKIPSGTRLYVTGPAGLTADLINAFSGIDGILLIVALISVFVILLIVYRSIILPFVVLITAMFALSGAILLVYQLALHGVIKLNGQSQGILSILVIGASTDYSLLFISRYREALETIRSKRRAILSAFKAVIEPIAASASTVVLALLCLLFSGLNSNKSLGPIAALGIVFAFLVTMSFLPAVLVLFGRAAFWPFEPKYVTSSKNSKLKLWEKVAAYIAGKPRKIWTVCLTVLLVMTFGLFQLKASGVSNAQSILGKSNAVSGQSVLKQHFAAGSGSPLVLIVKKSDVARVLNILKANANLTDPTILTYKGQQPINSLSINNARVINNQVLLNATLNQVASSNSAQNTVTNIREKFKNEGIDVLVGGETAISLDTNNTAKSDLNKIIPIVLLVVLLILIVLLRSIVAPVLLILSVILSYAATLGISAVVFNHILHFPGADPSVPLFGFIFLVALGVDYNIFLMTRVREDSLKTGTRKGIISGLSVTGSVITSAGIVLAATFAALAVIPILFLAQLAFLVAFGVLLDTLIVRSLLVPSLSLDIGSSIWWPSKLKSKN